jgi:hypothetical protein
MGRKKNQPERRGTGPIILGIALIVALGLLGSNLKSEGVTAVWYGTGEGSAPTEEIPEEVEPARDDEPLSAPTGVSVGPWEGDDKFENATIIIDTGRRIVDMPCRAWIVAIGTSLQESGLTNHGHLGDRNDHDSQGLFQQRPSQGWGTPEQVTDPVYASRKFYQKLSSIDGWQNMRLTQAAQRVQVSAFPDAYQKHKDHAIGIVKVVLEENGLSLDGCNLEGL